MLNKVLLAVVVAGAAIGSQARTVLPKQIPHIYSAGDAAAPDTEVTYGVHLAGQQQALESKNARDYTFRWTMAIGRRVEELHSYFGRAPGQSQAAPG